MNLETCRKYLIFVSNECERHLSDGRITDEELIQLIIEFKRFQDNIFKSILPEEIKFRISQIKLDDTIQSVNRGTWYLMAAFITFGAWANFISMRKQSKRLKTLTDIKFETSSLAHFILLHY
ncbi:hypothetical protein [Gaetbulibacter aestuarii]|uniref:Uncharacterized protein n=1 Tax=Gaetbulibacter aestuarii TaxID=1502358 RepID=A0ABW7N337_9FLAO